MTQISDQLLTCIQCPNILECQSEVRLVCKEMTRYDCINGQISDTSFKYDS